MYVSTYKTRVAWTVQCIILNKLYLKLKPMGHIAYTKTSIEQTHVCARLRLCQRVDEEFQIVEN